MFGLNKKLNLSNISDNSTDEWIWVEGYKGTNSDMQGYRGFQFEIGKEYTIFGEVEECKNGFHFSRTVRDVRWHYDIVKRNFHNHVTPTKNRLFTVEALVKKSDWNRENDKYVAKKIILTKEITNSDQVYETLIGMKMCYDHELYVLKDLDDFKSFLTDHNQWYANIYDLIEDIEKKELLESKNDLKNLMILNSFSELFIELIVSESKSKNIELYKLIKALCAESVSRDMLIYHIMKDFNGSHSKN